jgi:phosphatidylglycerophosphatase C
VSSTDPTTPVVAAFDVDGTLTVRDCVRPFLVEVGGWHRILWSLLRQPLRSLAAAARRDRDAMKEVVVGGVLHRRSVADVERAGLRFAERVKAGWLRPDTVARLRWHQLRGHRTVLVSASLGPYLRPLGHALGVDAVLCTEVVRNGERFGDRLDGANCRADEKARRLGEWMHAEQLDTVVVWAYGDSAGDRALLAAADHPVWVSDVVLSEAPAGRR